MKHARSDYDRIQDPAGLIPEDEPVFLLRGQDVFAVYIVEIYANLADSAGQHQIANLFRTHSQRMADWPKKKIPDLP